MVKRTKERTAFLETDKKKKRKVEICCQHYKKAGMGYWLHIGNIEVSCCDKCYKKAEEEIKEQRKLESQLKK